MPSTVGLGARAAARTSRARLRPAVSELVAISLGYNSAIVLYTIFVAHRYCARYKRCCDCVLTDPMEQPTSTVDAPTAEGLAFAALGSGSEGNAMVVQAQVAEAETPAQAPIVAQPPAAPVAEATAPFVVVQDAAHSLLSYDQPPSSFLQIPGGKEVGVEVFSLSKGYDMIGWRIGWVCGNATIVRAFADVKDNCDSGQFMAIQKAAAAAFVRYSWQNAAAFYCSMIPSA